MDSRFWPCPLNSIYFHIHKTVMKRLHTIQQWYVAKVMCWKIIARIHTQNAHTLTKIKCFRQLGAYHHKVVCTYHNKYCFCFFYLLFLHGLFSEIQLYICFILKYYSSPLNHPFHIVSKGIINPG